MESVPKTKKPRAKRTEPRPVGRTLKVVGARTHNLKNVSLEIPHNQFTVLTGVSGSGKSSLAFDTIYAEGQRQYIESLSTYARQFLNQLERADVDSIEGLQPTLCIDQRVAIANPRSTVSTVTEIYDFLRLLFARAGTPSCFDCGAEIARQSSTEIASTLAALPERSKVVLMAPMVRGRKGSHREVISDIQKAGLVRARVDGTMYEIDEVPELSLRQNHTIEAVVDRIVVRPSTDLRLAESVDLALKLANGLVTASIQRSDAKEDASGELPWKDELFSTRYSCATCGASFEEIEPRTFSFNSPYGACPDCDGIGTTHQFEPSLLLPECDEAVVGKLPLLTDAPKAVARQLARQIESAMTTYGLDWTASYPTRTKPERQKFLYGTKATPDTGFVSLLTEVYDLVGEDAQEWLAGFLQRTTCGTCNGARLRPEALAVSVDQHNIDDVARLSLADALAWIEQLEFTGPASAVAEPILAELLHRTKFLNKVGVGYLTLGRPADTLSGGELQRVRLATCIGSGLVGVTYILDEPSIGLHQRDNDRLIDSLRDLQRSGNTVLVVEHDEAMMRAADRVFDMGPGAGNMGGEIVAAGTAAEIQADPNSLTGAYLRGDRTVASRRSVRKISKKKQLRLTGATLNNLKNVSVSVPLGVLVGVTGVSGSGKSSLISRTLLPALARDIGQRTKMPGPHKKLTGIEHVEKMVEISQAPIGKSPRSTPATYTGVFDLIRQVFAGTRESKSRGYTLSRFSFNSGSGRCSQCQGQGQERIEMNFLPDMYVGCSVCGGTRFNRQTLRVRYKDRSVADVLAMTVDEAVDFFENFAKIHRLLKTLQDVGLGYLSLGQSSVTLSGGEAQRIKLASELARPEAGGTVYFLDEPTTGLHFEDVRRLVSVLDGLVDRGNTVIVIEHNLDVIAACDWLIDVGPEGGHGGGRIVVEGPPQHVATVKESLTGQFLG